MALAYDESRCMCFGVLSTRGSTLSSLQVLKFKMFNSRTIRTCLANVQSNSGVLLISALRRASLSASVNKDLNRDAHKKQANKIFDNERARQANLVARIEKIEVHVKDVKPHDDVTLIMNKNKSTPYDCAQHVHEEYVKRSVLAELDKGQLWDMHRPLEASTTLLLRHFREDRPKEVNKAFWRSCSFLLGMAIEVAFKDEIPVVRHSWPRPNVKSGSFVYDVALPTLYDWKPTQSELRTLTSVLWKIKDKKSRFERLEVDKELSKQIFQDNEFKLKQIQGMPGETVTLYRVDQHIDISVGPMIGDTSFVGRANFTAVHRIQSADGQLYRFQGLAIPMQIPISHYAYQVLCRQAEALNTT